MRELKSMGKSPGPCGVGAAATALPTRLRALSLGAKSPDDQDGGSPVTGDCHAGLYVPRTVMLNTDLSGAISLAAQGLTDQMFHIITALRGTPGVGRLRGICPAWLRVGRFVRLLVP